MIKKQYLNENRNRWNIIIYYNLIECKEYQLVWIISWFHYITYEMTIMGEDYHHKRSSIDG
ncbi:hypothetical protein Glove_97g72 [Diversispora epigaea]|uniref:Uncharacterized protein n=1 Tax=Diversispora epigaea TaxID=1348612 RepID=A0A397J786_9GLOM|nr:hypothetical protein Glove_97g72 [Diversispora epigaea]